MYVLLAAALLPAIALMAYVYSRDKVEKEPAALVMRVLLYGAISGIVAGIVEGILIGILEASLPGGLLLIIIEYFICVAAVEEACKYFCLNTVKKRPEFDYVFDAVVYAVAAALGFAALENVFYVFDGGLETALVRAVLSVPGHAADGVVMGVFYGIARREELHGNASRARTNYLLAFLLPTIEHGFYDAALSMDNDVMALFAVVFDLAFIGLAFVLVKRTAAKDAPLHPRTYQSMPLGQQPTPYGAPQQPASYGAPQQPSAYGAQQPAPFGTAQQSSPYGAQQQQPVVYDASQQQSAPYGIPQQQPAVSGAPQQQPAAYGTSWQSATQPAAYQQQPPSAYPMAASPASSAAAETWICPQCGSLGNGNFCGNCGHQRNSR